MPNAHPADTSKPKSTAFLPRPTATASLDLTDLGERTADGQTALYVLIDAEQTYTGDWRSSGHGYVDKDARYRLVHVINRHEKGEVRGYILTGGAAVLRGPANPFHWDEVDDAIERALGVTVKVPLCRIHNCADCHGAKRGAA